MDTVISVLLPGTASGLIYYWIDFFINGTVNVVNDDWYIKFQKSFPAADIWTAVCAVIGATGLIMDRSFGAFFTLITGSSLLFLGLMDITFNIQNRLYRFVRKSSQMKFEVFINVWTTGLGIALILLMWNETVQVPAGI